MIRISSAVLLLVVLVAITGCGNATKDNNAYVGATNDAVTRFESTFSSLQSEFTATSTPAQDVQTLEQFKTSVEAAVHNLQSIKPPAKVATLHAQLVAAVKSYADAIDKAKKGFVATSPRAIIAARTQFSASLTSVTAKIGAEIDAINAKLRK